MRVIYVFIFLTTFLYACREKPTNVWDTVGNAAKIVWETHRVPDVLSDTTWSKALNRITVSGTKVLISTLLVDGKPAFVVHVVVSEKNFEQWIAGLANETRKVKTSKTQEGIYVEVDNAGRKLVMLYHLPILLVSETPRAIDMTIDFLKTPKSTFATSNADLFKFSTLKSDSGNLYINHLNFEQLPIAPLLKNIDFFKNQTMQATLDVKTSDSTLSLIGFTKKESAMPLVWQPPAPVKMWSIIPSETQMFIHYGLADAVKFSQKNTDVAVERNIGNEIAYCAFSEAPDDYVVIVKSTDAQLFTHSVLSQHKDSKPIPVDFIHSIRDTTLLAWLKPLIPRFSLNFMSQHENYFVFAPSKTVLNKMQQAIDDDDVLGKSRAFMHYNNRNLQESNLTVLLNQLEQDTIPTLFPFPKKEAKWITYQWSTLDDALYTNVNIEYFKGNKKRQAEPVSITELLDYYPTYNKHTKEVQFFIRGKRLLTLRQTNKKIVWGQMLEEKTVSDFYSVDFYKNNKWQYLFATPSKIYVMDNLGRFVSDYPIDLPINISFADVIDYDNSKHYRWMVAGIHKIYLYNKSGKELQGWNPKEVNDTIICKPEHFKYRDNSYFLVVTQEGEINLFRRNGNSATGFPVTMPRPLPFYHINKSTGVMNFVTEKGELITVSIAGTIETKNLTLQNDYDIVQVGIDDDMYYVGMNNDKIQVYTLEGKQVFMIDDPSTEKLIPGVIRVQGKIVFTFFSDSHELSYVFDMNGKPLKSSPVFTRLPLKYLQVNKRDYVFKVIDDNVHEVLMEQ